MFEIRFARGVEQDLKALPAFHRTRLLDAMEKHLRDRPTFLARNRKLLVNLIPPWTAEPPIWELRVADYRVFYDVSETEAIVFVRAIRKKPPGKTTGEIL